jgi:hypothetical protein
MDGNIQNGMIFPEDLTFKLILMSRISFQEFLSDAPARVAAVFLLFPQMERHLRPKCLGGRSFRKQKALFRRPGKQEAAFLARALLALNGTRNHGRWMQGKNLLAFHCKSRTVDRKGLGNRSFVALEVWK